MHELQITYLLEQVKFLTKQTTRFPADFLGFIFTSKTSSGNREIYDPLSSPTKCCSRVTWCKGHMLLTMISREVMRNCLGITRLRGVVFRVKSRLPRTEQWGTPKGICCFFFPFHIQEPLVESYPPIATWDVGSITGCDSLGISHIH